MQEQDDNPENEIQSSRITEAIALLFITIVMLMLFIKIIFF
jgi:hypothetical protein